jgi:hypothetical protein
MGNMSATFVWLEGQRGPVPQIWYASVKREKQDRKVLAKYDLKPEELEFSLNDLAKFYPAPETKP